MKTPTSSVEPSPREAPRTSRAARWWGGRWALRCGALAVLASGAGVVPVAGAGAAAPPPVTPTAQVLSVPAVDGPVASEDAPPVVVSPLAPGAVRTPFLKGDALAAAGVQTLPPDQPVKLLATGPKTTRSFNMVSVLWDGAPVPSIGVEVRVRTGTGWTDWQPLEVEDSSPDPGSPELSRATRKGGTTPLWVSGGADAVDVRVALPSSAGSAAAVTNVRTSLVDPKTSVTTADGLARSAGSSPAATARADTRAMPGVITRAQWGADESMRLKNCSAPTYTGTPKVALVHHTAGSNSYSAADSAAIVRGIYYEHTQVQGWCDIGYNFLVDKYGQVFEGRYGGMDKAVLGAHTGGFNTDTFGVSMLGNFETATPTSAGMDALARVIAWKFAISHTDPTGTATLTSAGLSGSNIRYQAGAQVTVSTISGHRDLNATACPGANLYSQLPSLRTRVAQLVSEKEWDLRTTSSPGAPDGTAYFGDPRGTALSCDWDGDGTDGLAVYSAGQWAVQQSPSSSGPDLTFSYGSSTMVPVCGDWTGSGTDGIGVYDPATYTWWLRDTATPGPPDHKFVYGFKGVRPVVGDWDGKGRSGIGVYDGYSWWLRGTATPGPAGAVFQYGWPQATPVVGDWDGDGRDTVGVYSAGTWWLRNSITPGQPDSLFGYGAATDRPVVGRWDVSGVSTGSATSTPDRGDGVGVWRTWP
ncbi:peptidoglycan recognition protein family protein [Quadrisphaera oryzae]|uniref:peptidoglycan recognition protein family protein n=1 Tax=Quadrisphaera TaxID=317661 RepID=UPI001647462A|nr:N-acetylmuramoyl-L-alanine amidase [Quadrisphaera sp. RL12-1S]